MADDAAIEAWARWVEDPAKRSRHDVYRWNRYLLRIMAAHLQPIMEEEKIKEVTTRLQAMVANGQRVYTSHRALLLATGMYHDKMLTEARDAAKRLLTAAQNAIVKAVSKGDTVSIRGFMVFFSRKVPAVTRNGWANGMKVRRSYRTSATTIPVGHAGYGFRLAVRGLARKQTAGVPTMSRSSMRIRAWRAEFLKKRGH